MKINKMPEFYMIIALKYFPEFSFFFGGGAPPVYAPVSYAYAAYWPRSTQPLGQLSLPSLQGR